MILVIAWAKIIYGTNTYIMKYNVVARNHFIFETILFTHLHDNYDNEKHAYQE